MKTLIATCFVLVLGLVFGGLQAQVYAGAAKDAIQDGASQASGQDAASANADQGVTNIIRNVTRIFSYIIGAISVIMIMYGGFRYITSGGDSSAAATARKIIIYAAIGLVVAVLAQLISRVVVGETQNSISGTGSSQSGGNNNSGGSTFCPPTATTC